VSGVHLDVTGLRAAAIGCGSAWVDDGKRSVAKSVEDIYQDALL
jgi:hypothetical protein